MKRTMGIILILGIVLIITTTFLTGCLDDGDSSNNTPDDCYLSVTVVVTNKIPVDAKITGITIGVRSGDGGIRDVGTGNQQLLPGETRSFSGWYIPPESSG